MHGNSHSPTSSLGGQRICSRQAPAHRGSPTEERASRSDLQLNCKGTLIYAICSASSCSHHPSSPLLGCTKHSSESRRKAPRNNSPAFLRCVTSDFQSQTYKKMENDSCLLLQHMPKFKQCQVLEGEEKLCSTPCNCRQHVAELRPQCKHRTCMVLVLKG